MFDLEFSITIIEIVMILGILLMVITIFYTGEILTRELLLEGFGLIMTTIIFVILYQYPELYNNTSYIIPYINQSLFLILSLIIGLMLPFYAIVLLYRRVMKTQRILTYMNRGRERLNIIDGKINQLGTNIKQVSNDINDIHREIKDKKEEITHITFIRW
jgi:hypothetical protein